jgi:hypothetical protein
MKLRDMMFLVIGGLLVISGMVLNTLISGDADAQVGLKDATFGYVTCKGLIIKDGYKNRGYFGLNTNGDAILKIYGDDGETDVAYLGGNRKQNNEMMFHLQSQTDKRMASMQIDKNGGRFDSINKMGEQVAFLGVVDDGGGLVGTRDKFGYKR